MGFKQQNINGWFPPLITPLQIWGDSWWETNYFRLCAPPSPIDNDHVPSSNGLDQVGIPNFSKPHVKAGWWFGAFFIFPYIGNNHPIWLIFFKMVEATNQKPKGDDLDDRAQMYPVHPTTSDLIGRGSDGTHHALRCKDPAREWHGRNLAEGVVVTGKVLGS